jgi:dUTP pyrophosphatase
MAGHNQPPCGDDFGGKRFFESDDDFDMDTPIPDEIQHLLAPEKVRVQRLPHYAGPDGKVFVRATKNSAGVELYATKDVVLLPGEQAIIPTGLRIALPEDMELQIRSKSGRTAKERLVVSNSPGTIDGDYRGEVGVIVQNLNPTLTLDELSVMLGMVRTYIHDQVEVAITNYHRLITESEEPQVNAGADYDCCPVDEANRTVFISKGQKIAQGVFAYYASPDEVEVDNLDETERGAGGFGSSGL